MSWPAFRCDEPDFFVRSMRDDPPVKFGVLRKALLQSEIFRDMFHCCDSGYAVSMADDMDQVLDLDEPAEMLNMLLSLLHAPPGLPERKPNVKNHSKTTSIAFEPGSVVPLPLLPRMLHLADKYALSETLQRSLLAHMSAHVCTYPLQIYAFATRRGLQSLAIDASKHLLQPRLSAYSPKDIKIIPNPEAWQRLVLLHDVRIRGLRGILLGEEIFPHGYGTCSSHKAKAISLWNRKKLDIILKIDAATDVAAEMSVLEDDFSSCKICYNACSAAVKMLEYKCQRLPTSIKKLNESETGDQWLSTVMEKYAR